VTPRAAAARCRNWEAPAPAAAGAGAARVPLVAELSLQLAAADGLTVTPGLVLARRGRGAAAAALAVHAECRWAGRAGTAVWGARVWHARWKGVQRWVARDDWACQVLGVCSLVCCPLQDLQF